MATTDLDAWTTYQGWRDAYEQLVVTLATGNSTTAAGIFLPSSTELMFPYGALNRDELMGLPLVGELLQETAYNIVANLLQLCIDAATSECAIRWYKTLTWNVIQYFWSIEHSLQAIGALSVMRRGGRVARNIIGFTLIMYNLYCIFITVSERCRSKTSSPPTANSEDEDDDEDADQPESSGGMSQKLKHATLSQADCRMIRELCQLTIEAMREYFAIL